MSQTPQVLEHLLSEPGFSTPHCSGLTRFRPAWWLPGPHAQTVGARVLRSLIRVPVRRERWTTPDGDFLDLDFCEPPGVRRDVLVVILHGLEGSSRSGYVRVLFRELAARGLASVGMNFRSCSGEPNRALRLYHSGETSDPSWVAERLAARDGVEAVAAVGISLGANVLLKLLGEQGTGTNVRAAAALSTPFDLARGARFMEHGLSRVYMRRLVRSLQTKLRARGRDFAGVADLPRALAATGFWDFDDAATAPIHGFASAEDYYHRCSSAAFLRRIRTPVLLVQADDDPFVPAAAIPRAELAAHPEITSALQARGGHVGFVAGAVPGRPQFWAETEIAGWMARRLS